MSGRQERCEVCGRVLNRYRGKICSRCESRITVQLSAVWANANIEPTVLRAQPAQRGLR